MVQNLNSITSDIIAMVALKNYVASASAAASAFRFLCLECIFLSKGVMAHAFESLNSLSIDSKTVSDLLLLLINLSCM